MKIMNARKLIALCAAVFLTLSADAQLTLTGTSYSQNFDGLDSGLPAGWSVNTNASATSVGLAVSFATSHTNWSSTTGAFGNYASTTNNAGATFLGTETTATQNACANRALGIRQTSAFGDPGAAFVLNIANTSGMENFKLCLDFLMLSVQPRSTVWTVDYAVGSNPTRFTPLATFADPGVFGTTHTNISFGAALDGKGSNVWIRVVALNSSTGSNYRDTFALDNVSLSWTAAPVITGMVITDGNVQIDFTGTASDTTSLFLLLGATEVDGSYANAGAAITQLGTGQFRAICPVNGSQQFYCVERQQP
jgi:hypothetical protein